MKLGLIWIAAIVAILGFALLGVAYGATPLPAGAVARVLGAWAVPGLDAGVSGPIRRIVLDLRLPRVILAASVGSGLAVVGLLLQTATRNDLADPFLFGLSSGAAAGAVSVIRFFGDRLGPWTVPVAAFAGALLSAAVVLALVRHEREKGPERLVIAGLAVSFLFGAATMYVVFSGDQRAASSVLFWSVGGLGLASWTNVPLAIGGAALAIATSLAARHQLDALLAGDETAGTLGIAVERARLIIFGAAALATAALVALSGVIGFVGLMVPHLARSLAGVRHGPLAVTAALLGALLMLAGDLVSRVVLAPQELPVGIVTAAAGGLFVLTLLWQSHA